MRRAIGCGERHFPDEGGIRWADVLAVPDAAYHRVVESVEQWASDRGPEILVLAGTRGTGKTQLAVLALAKAVINCRRSKGGFSYEFDGVGHYYRVRTLLGTVKETYSPDEPESEMELLRRLASTPYMVLDEYAAVGLSETDRAILQELFDRRYEQLRRTIIITNVTRDGLQDVMDDSTLSRIQETGVVLECTWPSFRAAARIGG